MWTITASLYLLAALPLLLLAPEGAQNRMEALYAGGLLLLYANLIVEKGARLSGTGSEYGALLSQGLRVSTILVALLIWPGERTLLLFTAVATFVGRSALLLLPSREDADRFPCFSALLPYLAAAALIIYAIMFRGGSGVEQLASALLLGSALLELLYRVRRRERELAWERRDLPQLRGLLPSFLIYYGIPFRLWRLRRFYRAFVAPGSLVFDVGAHVGNRVRAFRSLDARVVAFEPQRSCLLTLHRLYGSDSAVFLTPVALGAEEGEAELFVAPKTPTMSTLSTDWIEQIHEHYPEQGIAWERRERVTVATMDQMIARYGSPEFVKIDVEGFEAEVLAGLSTPVRALSFEFLPAAKEGALACLTHLERLGAYQCNYSLGERMRLELSDWVSLEEMRRRLEAMEPGSASGDIYGVLRSKTT
ncbi:MAG: FkbM family methyltransferase [Spirochaetaceae bacterium]